MDGKYLRNVYSCLSTPVSVGCKDLLRGQFVHSRTTWAQGTSHGHRGQLFQQTWASWGSAPAPYTHSQCACSPSLGGPGSKPIPGCAFTRPLSPADITALKQQVAALQTQLQGLQSTLSQYKKGEFLDLNLSQTLRLSPDWV